LTASDSWPSMMGAAPLRPTRSRLLLMATSSALERVPGGTGTHTTTSGSVWLQE
jgi:hypothetical protein